MSQNNVIFSRHRYRHIDGNWWRHWYASQTVVALSGEWNRVCLSDNVNWRDRDRPVKPFHGEYFITSVTSTRPRLIAHAWSWTCYEYDWKLDTENIICKSYLPDDGSSRRVLLSYQYFMSRAMPLYCFSQPETMTIVNRSLGKTCEECRRRTL